MMISAPPARTATKTQPAAFCPNSPARGSPTYRSVPIRGGDVASTPSGKDTVSSAPHHRVRSWALIFSTVSGKPIAPNNVLRRWVWPACQAADLPRATWLTFRRTYSSWAHDKGVPAKVVAQIMGHTKVDTTMNVYTQVRDGAARAAADRVGSELFRIVQKPENDEALTH
jgi:hypothetical protein